MTPTTLSFVSGIVVGLALAGVFGLVSCAVADRRADRNRADITPALRRKS
jgi:hypothetical protein